MGDWGEKRSQRRYSAKDEGYKGETQL